jgi:hypothetical protein
MVRVEMGQYQIGDGKGVNTGLSQADNGVPHTIHQNCPRLSLDNKMGVLVISIRDRAGRPEESNFSH